MHGSIGCNRATNVSIFVFLTQTIANRAQVQGFSPAFVDCTPPATSWLVTIMPEAGRYIAGKASASASAFACDHPLPAILTRSRKPSSCEVIRWCCQLGERCNRRIGARGAPAN